MSIKTLITTEYWIKKMTKWQEVNLGDVCKININNYSEIDGYRYVNYLDTGNITQNKIETIQKIDLSIDKLPVRAKRKAVLNDIVYSTVRPNQLHYGIIREKIENFLVSTGFTVISVDTEIAIPIYVYYYIIQPRITESMQAIAEQSVSAYPSIKPSDLAKIKIFLPPLNIQKKIAGVLGALDDKIELNNKINQNLEAQAQALFKSWFIDFEPFGGKMPNDWKIGKVDDIVDLYDSQRIPLSNNQRSKMKKIYPYYGATSVMDFVEEYIFDGKYLLLGEDGTVIDNKGFPILQYVWGKFWVNNHAHIMTGKNGFTVESLYLFFKQTNVKEIVTGAVQPKINQSNLKALKVRIPTHIVMNEFNQITAPLFSLFRRNTEENFRLAELRDTLLPKLMNGEIDVDNVKID